MSNPIPTLEIEHSNKKTILTKYLPCTNHRGSRIKAYTRDHSITVPYDSEGGQNAHHEAAARALCEKLNWTGKLVSGGTREGLAFVFVD